MVVLRHCTFELRKGGYVFISVKAIHDLLFYYSISHFANKVDERWIFYMSLSERKDKYVYLPIDINDDCIITI